MHLIINSSFLYRTKQSIKTGQSQRRLVTRLSANGKRIRSNGVSISDGFVLKGHYKLLPPQEATGFISLESAIAQELASLGDLVFILVGTVRGLRPSAQEVNSALIKELRIDPSLSGADVQQVEQAVYGLRRILPLEDLFSEIARNTRTPGGLSAEDRQAIAKAYDQMLDAAITEVTVPQGAITRPEETILGQIVGSLQSQTTAYRSALNTLQSAPNDHRAMNEVLRIAYNFSTDVLPLISLFMNICDIKPLVFWCTVKEQWELHAAFASLPWATLGRKEKLDEYEAIVSQARSHAFHHILPFDSTVEVDVTTLNVRAERIRLFLPFGQKHGRGIHMRDQRLLDVLTEFSRAKERPVSTVFWRANLMVVQKACELAQAVLNTLVMLNELRNP